MSVTAKIAAVAITSAVATIAPIATNTADAATPRCVVKNYVFSVTGGCDGMGQPGHDRLVVRCRVKNSGAWTDYYLPWHDRRGSWQQTALCGADRFVWQAWMEHKDT